jgi:hypothetical protein
MQIVHTIASYRATHHCDQRNQARVFRDLSICGGTGTHSVFSSSFLFGWGRLLSTAESEAMVRDETTASSEEGVAVSERSFLLPKFAKGDVCGISQDQAVARIWARPE